MTQRQGERRNRQPQTENQRHPVPGEIIGDSANLEGEQPQDPEFHAELPPVTLLYVPQSALFQTDSAGSGHIMATTTISRFPNHR